MEETKRRRYIIRAVLEGEVDFSEAPPEPKSDMNGWTDGVVYTDLEIIENTYINRYGVRSHYNGWNCTGYVPCDGCSTLEFVDSQMGSEWNCFYDQDHVKLQAEIMIPTGHQTITVPEGAYFFSISETAAHLAATIENGIIPHA